MDRLDRNVVHEICTNQVVVTLHACVKELVENSLDAGAARIEVKIRESGAELLEVVDNGRGIEPEDYAKLATRHATSKIREYDDLSKSLATFGFRGEALAAIAAMGEMTVCTRTATQTTAAALTYDRFGKLASEAPAAREMGTTVSVRDLFKRLPVRHREFMRNAKAQVSATLRLIQSYAIAQPQIRFQVTAEKSRGTSIGRATLLCTSGSCRGWRQATASVLGDGAVAGVESLELQSESTGWAISGIISTPLGGRRARDAQLYFVNRRPIDPPKRIAKLINDTYHQYNSRMWPVVILSFSAAQGLVDVNVTPDKRTVFLHNEENLLAEIQQKLTELWSTAQRGPGTTLAAFGIGGEVGRGQGSDGTGVSADCNMQFTFETPREIHADETVVSAEVAAETNLVPVSHEARTPDIGANMRKLANAAAPGALESPEKLAALAPLPPPEPSERTTQGTTEQVPSPDFHMVEFMGNSTEPVSSVTAGSKRQAPSCVAGAWGDRLSRKRSRCSDEGDDDNAGMFLQVIELDALPPPNAVGDIVSGAAAMDAVVDDAGPGRAGGALVLDGLLVQEYLPDPVGAMGASLAPTRAARAAPSGSPGTAEDLLVVAASGGHAEDAPVPEALPLPAPVDAAAPAAARAIPAAVRTDVGLTELEVAVRRRRDKASRARRISSLGAAAAAANVQFPNAFSLASLGAGQQGPSIEDVAKFGTTGNIDEGSGGSQFKFDQNCFTQMRVIGQFNLGFIIAALATRTDHEDDDDDNGKRRAPPSGADGLQLFIIDQHASDEKFRFEGLNRESRIDRQPLVKPHQLQLTPAQESLADAHAEIFRLNGFELIHDETRPPGRRLQLTTLPTCNGLVFGNKDVQDLLYTLEESESQQAQPGNRDASSAKSGLLDLAGHRGLWSATAVPRPPKVWQLLACRACRGAIMIGKALRVSEMERILANLCGLQQPWNCPHGRPTLRHLVDAGVARQTAGRPQPLRAKLDSLR